MCWDTALLLDIWCMGRNEKDELSVATALESLYHHGISRTLWASGLQTTFFPSTFSPSPCLQRNTNKRGIGESTCSCNSEVEEKRLAREREREKDGQTREGKLSLCCRRCKTLQELHALQALQAQEAVVVRR